MTVLTLTAATNRFTRNDRSIEFLKDRCLPCKEHEFVPTEPISGQCTILHNFIDAKIRRFERIDANSECLHGRSHACADRTSVKWTFHNTKEVCEAPAQAQAQRAWIKCHCIESHSIKCLTHRQDIIKKENSCCLFFYHCQALHYNALHCKIVCVCVRFILLALRPINCFNFLFKPNRCR